MEYHVPDFDEVRAYERRAQEIRTAEMSRLVRGAFTWLRDVLHIGHHGRAHTAH